MLPLSWIDMVVRREEAFDVPRTGCGHVGVRHVKQN
jgi:hypothetical protein